MSQSAQHSYPRGTRTVQLNEAVGTVLAQDINEVGSGHKKSRAFRAGHIIRQADLCRLEQLGSENFHVLDIGKAEVHQDEAVRRLSTALAGRGVTPVGEPGEGRMDLLAANDGLLKINREALERLNMLGDVMCATVHEDTVVRTSHLLATTCAIPIVLPLEVLEEAEDIAGPDGIVEVKPMRKPMAGVLITGSEVFHGHVRDGFGPLIAEKIRDVGGTIVGMYFAPDDVHYIEARLRELLAEGADLLIITGGMSADPDDVTRHALRHLGAQESVYGAPVLPGAMSLVAYLRSGTGRVPVLGVPACGLYHRAIAFDVILPRVLAGEKLSRADMARLGHGGLCLQCDTCHYPVCPFGK